MPSLHQTEFYFFPHFVSRISPIVPPEIVSPSTGLPRKMILVSNLYPFGPNRFQALHGASIRHSLQVLAVQLKVCFHDLVEPCTRRVAALSYSSPLRNQATIPTQSIR